MQFGNDTAGSGPASTSQPVKYERSILTSILLSGLLLRLYMVLSTSYIWDEDREWIPLGRSISFWGATRNLPWRTETHIAITAYAVKATSLVFGENQLGYRLAGVIAGVVAIYAVMSLAREWLGFQAAALTAALMAFNEYHIGLSSLAVPKAPSLACVALALLHLGRYMKNSRPLNLYLAAVFAGVGFLFYETTAFLLPACLLSLVLSGRAAAWLRRKEVWIAGAIGVLIISPDLVWNFLHWDRGYGLHSGRLAGIGVTAHFFLFFGRDFLISAAHALGKKLYDPLEEYPAMNVFWGALLLTASAVALVWWKKLQPIYQTAAIFFWGVFLFFTFGKAGAGRVQGIVYVDPKAWFWVDHILVSACLLAGWGFSCLPGRWKRFAVAVVLLVSSYSVFRVVRHRLNMPSAQIALSPAFVWPPDGRSVEVKAFVNACQLCDPQLSLVDTRLNRNDGSGEIALPPSEVEATPGTDDRVFQIRPQITSSSNRQTYIFNYRVVDHGAEEVLSAKLNVQDGRRPPPFWARD